MKQSRGQFRATAAGGFGSPAQLTNCPWCSSPIDPGRQIRVETPRSGRGRTIIYCGDPLGQCPFSERQAPGELIHLGHELLVGRRHLLLDGVVAPDRLGHRIEIDDGDGRRRVAAALAGGEPGEAGCGDEREGGSEHDWALRFDGVWISGCAGAVR